jgi:hypothetical protein
MHRRDSVHSDIHIQADLTPSPLYLFLIPVLIHTATRWQTLLALSFKKTGFTINFNTK